jgi:hypothetical protein
MERWPCFGTVLGQLLEPARTFENHSRIRGSLLNISQGELKNSYPLYRGLLYDS